MVRMSNKQRALDYVAPMLEEYEVAVEQGFGVSGGAGSGGYEPWSYERVEEEEDPINENSY